MGGGFGSKALSVGAEGLICARLAKEASAPVKLMLDRKEEHLATGNRPSAAARIKAGVSADGIITAFDAESWGTGGAGAAAGFPLPYIYRIANRRRTHKDVFINTGQQRPMRAPGHPQGSFITEIMMDELADKVNMDPVEFRIKNLPPEAPNAMWRAYLREGAAEFGWDKRHPTGDKTPGPIKTGMGVAVCTWGGGGRGPAQAHCEIASDGSVDHAARHAGPRHRHADARRDRHRRFARTPGRRKSTPQIGDTLYGVSPLSGGSTTAASISPAIRVAAVKALDALKEKVAPALGVDAASLVAAGGRIHVRDNPSRGVSWAEACKQIGPQPIAVDGDWQPGLSSVTTSGVQFAEVTVDVETGIVEADADPRDPGLRPRGQPAHGGKPGLRRRHRVAQFRDVRGPHPRSQHRADGQSEHGVVPARGHVGHPADRRAPQGSAGARRHRHRRAADGPDGGGDRARGPERHRRHGAQPAADAGQDSAGAAAADATRTA